MGHKSHNLKKMKGLKSRGESHAKSEEIYGKKSLQRVHCSDLLVPKLPDKEKFSELWDLSSEIACGEFRAKMAAGDTPCNTHTIQVWYISLHLVDFYGKNVGKYTIHGLFGYVFFAEKKHMKKPLQAQTAKKSRSGLLFGQRIHEKNSDSHHL